MKILNPIISPISVEMMDNFKVFEGSTKMSSHYKPMFKNILFSSEPFSFSFGEETSRQSPITVKIISPTFPSWMFYTSLIGSSFTPCFSSAFFGTVLQSLVSRFIDNHFFSAFFTQDGHLSRTFSFGSRPTSLLTHNITTVYSKRNSFIKG